MIIQLRAAIFERIRNVQIKALQKMFLFVFYHYRFLCVFHLWFKRYRRHVVYNDVMRNSVTCYLTVRHITENHYVKCPLHFFGWKLFYLLSYEQNLLTNRIAGKLMNIKKIKLFHNENTPNTRFLNVCFSCCSLGTYRLLIWHGYIFMLVKKQLKIPQVLLFVYELQRLRQLQEVKLHISLHSLLG